MNTRSYLLIISMLIMFSACCDDDNADICETSVRGVDSFLDSASKSYLQNYWDHDQIYFLEDNLDTVVFKVVNRVDTLLPYSEFVPCVVDSTMEQIREGFFQEQYVSLYNDDLNLFFYLRIINQSLTEISVSDKLWIAKGVTDEFNLANVVNGSNLLSEYSTFSRIGNIENPFVIEYDSLAISGKTFYGVIEPNPLNTGLPNNLLPLPNIKYTRTQGLVSITDDLSGKHFVYCCSE